MTKDEILEAKAKILLGISTHTDSLKAQNERNVAWVELNKLVLELLRLVEAEEKRLMSEIMEHYVQKYKEGFNLFGTCLDKLREPGHRMSGLTWPEIERSYEMFIKNHPELIAAYESKTDAMFEAMKRRLEDCDD